MRVTINSQTKLFNRAERHCMKVSPDLISGLSVLPGHWTSIYHWCSLNRCDRVTGYFFLLWLDITLLRTPCSSIDRPPLTIDTNLSTFLSLSNARRLVCLALSLAGPPFPLWLACGHESPAREMECPCLASCQADFWNSLSARGQSSIPVCLPRGRRRGHTLKYIPVAQCSKKGKNSTKGK